MFETLIESSGGTKRRAGGTVLSLLVHAMVVAGAVQATERVMRIGAVPRADTTVVFVEPDRPAVPAPDPSSEVVRMR